MDWIRNMKLALRILVALLVLVAAMGAESSCDPQRRPPEPKPASSPVKRTVDIRANSPGPYSVLLIVNDPKTGGLKHRKGPELVAGGEYREQYEYNSGDVVGVQILVWGNMSDTMRCSITDGAKVDSQQRKKEVLCLLLTSR